MEIIQSILTNNPCYRAGKKITVKGLMLHSVGCPQPNAETFVKKWNNPEGSRACIKYTGGAAFTCSDKEAAMAVVKRTYGVAAAGNGGYVYFVGKKKDDKRVGE